MATDAFQQQDEMDARFARVFQPIDRMGANDVAIAQLNYQRQLSNQARLQKMFDTIQEQQFKAGETSKELVARASEGALSRSATSALYDKQAQAIAKELVARASEGALSRSATSALYDKQAQAIAKRMEDDDKRTSAEKEKAAKQNGITYKKLRADQESLNKEYEELSTVSKEEQNRNAVAAVRTSKLPGWFGKEALKTKIIDEINKGGDYRKVLAKYVGNGLDQATVQSISDSADALSKATLESRIPKLIDVQKRQGYNSQQIERVLGHLIDTGAYDPALEPGAGKTGSTASLPMLGPEEQSPLAALRAGVAAQKSAPTSPAASNNRTMFGQVPLYDQARNAVADVAGNFGGMVRDTAGALVKPLIDPIREVGNVAFGSSVVAPPVPTTPEQASLAQGFHDKVGSEVSGVNALRNSAASALKPMLAGIGGIPPDAQPAANPGLAFQNVSLTVPISDTEVPGIRMLLKEKKFPDVNIEMFINEARRGGEKQVHAWDLLRQELKARSAGQVFASPMLTSPQAQPFNADIFQAVDPGYGIGVPKAQF